MAEEEGFMARQILVALENPDRIEHFLPYIDQVIQSHTKLVLLVRYDDSDSRPLMDELRTFHSGFFPGPVFNRISTERLAHRLHAAEQRIFPACRSLSQRGVEIAVRLYAAPVRKVVKQYLRKEDFQMVIMHPPRARRLLAKLSSVFRSFRSHDLDGVLLIHPSRTLKA